MSLTRAEYESKFFPNIPSESEQVQFKLLHSVDLLDARRRSIDVKYEQYLNDLWLEEN